MQIPNQLMLKTSTVNDGNMSFQFGDENTVSVNREKFVGHKNFVCMKCNHGDTIKIVNDRSAKVVAAEVLVTQTPNLTLMLLTADCLPTVFHDPTTKTIALGHFSRETIAAGLPQKTVGFLRQELSIKPDDLQILVGPHIHKQSYSFPLPLETVSERIAPFMSRVNEQAYIDLAAAHNSQLIESGVKETNIQLSDIDTFTSPEHFSHFESTRDDQKPHGRLATILMMN